MMVKGPSEYITGFYKEDIFKIRWRTEPLRGECFPTELILSTAQL
jgi:hypothetical protein